MTGPGRRTTDGYRLRFAGEELAVVSLSTDDVVDHPALTAAEANVATLSMRGLSNREIAAERGTTVRTVANQLASIYRKLDVADRRELILVLLDPMR